MKPHHFYRDCIQELNLDEKMIDECFNGILGTILQLFAQIESIRALDKLQGVPAIVYNDVIDTESSYLSLNEFEKVFESKVNRTKTTSSLN